MSTKTEQIREIKDRIKSIQDQYSLGKSRNMGIAKVRRRLLRTLLIACPELPKKVAASLADDLADISQIGLKHQKFIRRFLSLRLPDELEEAETLLIYWIDVELLFHNQWHLNRLKRELPKLLRAIAQSGAGVPKEGTKNR